MQFSAAGTPTQPITLRSYPGERATVAIDYLEIPHGTDYVTVSDLDIDGQEHPSPTVQVMASDTVLQSLSITNHHIAESCLVLGSLSGYGQAVRTTVRRDRFMACGNPLNGMHDHGIYVESSLDAEITGNVLWDAPGWGIQLYPYAQRTLVAHNVIDGTGGGILIGGKAGGLTDPQGYASNGTTVEYNVITNITANTACSPTGVARSGRATSRASTASSTRPRQPGPQRRPGHLRHPRGRPVVHRRRPPRLPAERQQPLPEHRRLRRRGPAAVGQRLRRPASRDRAHVARRRNDPLAARPAPPRQPPTTTRSSACASASTAGGSSTTAPRRTRAVSRRRGSPPGRTR